MIIPVKIYLVIKLIYKPLLQGIHSQDYFILQSVFYLLIKLN